MIVLNIRTLGTSSKLPLIERLSHIRQSVMFPLTLIIMSFEHPPQKDSLRTFLANKLCESNTNVLTGCVGTVRGSFHKRLDAKLYAPFAISSFSVRLSTVGNSGLYGSFLFFPLGRWDEGGRSVRFR